MLDKTSEKVLKYIIANSENKGTLLVLFFNSSDSDKLNMSFSLFCSTCEFLQKEGYIKEFQLYYEQTDGRLFLTFKGYSYFEYKKIENLEFYKQLALSKISDIIVSAIVALITALIVA